MAIKSKDGMPMVLASIAMVLGGIALVLGSIAIVLGGIQYLAGRKRKHNAGQNARIPEPISSCAHFD